MTAVIQRVSRASVVADGNPSGSCGAGLYVLLGVSSEDIREDAEALAKKIVNLRIFTDENGKMNLSLLDVNGDMLVVSNFTLMASYRKGNRPDYMNAAAPAVANELYEYFTELCRQSVKSVETGVFGAYMELASVNDGPVTVVMDTKDVFGGNER